MNTEDVWRAIDDQRLRLVTLLQGLSEEEWRITGLPCAMAGPSSCCRPRRPETEHHLVCAAEGIWIAIREGGMNPAIAAVARSTPSRPTSPPQDP